MPGKETLKMKNKITAALIMCAALLGLADVGLADRWLHPKCKQLSIEMLTGGLGPFVKLSDGGLMCFDKGFARISRDNGKSWPESHKIYDGPGPGRPMVIQIALRTRDGVIILAYNDAESAKYSWDEVKGELGKDATREVWAIRSLDDGKTWVDRQRLLGGHAAVHNSVSMIQTKSGHIVVPIQDGLRDPGRVGQYTCVSADNGKSWKRSNLIDIGGHGNHDGGFEATVVELSDERLLMLLRTNLDRFWEAYSDDHGYYWRHIWPSQIDASSAPPFITRLASGRLILAWCRLYPEGIDEKAKKNYPRKGGHRSEVMASWQRNELSVAFSEDDAKTWTKPVVIARDDSPMMTYPYIFECQPGLLWIGTHKNTSLEKLYISALEKDLFEESSKGKFKPIAKTLTAEATNQVSWVEDTFEDFADGRLDASGQNIYVSRDGKIRTILRFDINDDGYLDLFSGNTHDIQHIVKPSLCQVIPGRQLKQSKLAVRGSNQVKMADLNRDSYPDLVFALTSDGLQVPRQFLSIVYGGPDGWPAYRVTGHLPTNTPKAIAIPDLNADGWPDIAVINRGDQISHISDKENIRIYWGSEGGFVLSKYQDIGMAGARWLASADFDKDGAEDLAVLSTAGKIRIFWAGQSQKSPIKFKTANISLPTAKGTCLTATNCDLDSNVDLVIGTSQDKTYLVRGRKGRSWHKAKGFSSFAASHISAGNLDADGYPDLVLSHFSSAAAGQASVSGSSENVTTHIKILWGGKKGFSASQSSELAAKYAYATDMGDLDNDGLTDLAVAIYQGEETFEAQSPVYFGLGDRKFQLCDDGIDTAGATDVVITPPDGKLGGRMVFSNSVAGTLYEKVPVYVYWGGEDGFDPARRWVIPGQSGHEATAAELNADGFTDFIVTYTAHGGDVALKNPIVGANIFWGGAKGFDVANKRTILYEPWMCQGNVADLNKDGYLDLVLGGWVPWFGPRKDEPAEVAIYYGSQDGIDPNNKVTLESKGRSLGVILADFNHDDWLDIAVSSKWEDLVRIFWGNPDGFDVARQKQLLTPAPVGMECADINADGFLDLLVASYKDEEAGYFDAGNFIFWGSSEGFKQWNSQWLPSTCTLYQAIADFDGDGFLDLFFPNYHGQLNREELASYLYWGGPEGFGQRNRTLFICDSACGAQTGDFDHDGLIDLAVANHTAHGNHKTDSKVFYNDGNRFANPRTQSLPSLGAHSMWCEDMGHIYDRKHRQRYESSVFNWNRAMRAGQLTCRAVIPEGAELTFAVRSAARREATSKQPWRTVLSDSFSLDAADRYLQYRATFKSDNGDRYPVIDRVSVVLTPTAP